jgi:hypothetical protein
MKILSIDGETLGLYGPVFQIGYVLVDENEELESGFYGIDMNLLTWHNTRDINWCRENCATNEITHNKVDDMLEAFWQDYIRMRGLYPDMIVVADWGAPIEANIFRQCVLLNLEERCWLAPGPLHEVGTALLMASRDPKKTYSRLESELPVHHPTADSRQSARLFIEAMGSCLSVSHL